MDWTVTRFLPVAVLAQACAGHCGAAPTRGKGTLLRYALSAQVRSRGGPLRARGTHTAQVGAARGRGTRYASKSAVLRLA